MEDPIIACSWIVEVAYIFFLYQTAYSKTLYNVLFLFSLVGYTSAVCSENFETPCTRNINYIEAPFDIF